MHPGTKAVFPSTALVLCPQIHPSVHVPPLQDGCLAYELTGLGNDTSPMAVTGDGRVVLACTNRGSVVSIAWPKDPEAAGQKQREQQQLLQPQQQQQQQSMGGFAGLLQQSDPFLVHAGNGAAYPLSPGSQAATPAATAGSSTAPSAAAVHAGFLKHLSIQVGTGTGPLASPKGSAVTPGCAGMPAAKTPGSAVPTSNPHTAKTSHSAASPPGSAYLLGSIRLADSLTNGDKSYAGRSTSSPSYHQQQQLGLDTPATLNDGWTAPSSPGPMFPGSFTPGPMSPGPLSPGADRDGSRAWQGADGSGGATTHRRWSGLKEFRLHSSRITAIKVLHTAGVVFTARWAAGCFCAVQVLLTQ